MQNVNSNLGNKLRNWRLSPDMIEETIDNAENCIDGHENNFLEAVHVIDSVSAYINRNTNSMIVLDAEDCENLNFKLNTTIAKLSIPSNDHNDDLRNRLIESLSCLKDAIVKHEQWAVSIVCKDVAHEASEEIQNMYHNTIASISQMSINAKKAIKKAVGAQDEKEKDENKGNFVAGSEFKEEFKPCPLNDLSTKPPLEVQREKEHVMKDVAGCKASLHHVPASERPVDDIPHPTSTQSVLKTGANMIADAFDFRKTSTTTESAGAPTTAAGTHTGRGSAAGGTQGEYRNYSIGEEQGPVRPGEAPLGATTGETFHEVKGRASEIARDASHESWEAARDTSDATKIRMDTALAEANRIGEKAKVIVKEGAQETMAKGAEMWEGTKERVGAAFQKSESNPAQNEGYHRGMTSDANQNEFRRETKDTELKPCPINDLSTKPPVEVQREKEAVMKDVESCTASLHHVPLAERPVDDIPHPTSTQSVLKTGANMVSDAMGPSTFTSNQVAPGVPVYRSPATDSSAAAPTKVSAPAFDASSSVLHQPAPIVGGEKKYAA